MRRLRKLFFYLPRTTNLVLVALTSQPCPEDRQHHRTTPIIGKLFSMSPHSNRSRLVQHMHHNHTELSARLNAVLPLTVRFQHLAYDHETSPVVISSAPSEFPHPRLQEGPYNFKTKQQVAKCTMQPLVCLDHDDSNIHDDLPRRCHIHTGIKQTFIYFYVIGTASECQIQKCKLKSTANVKNQDIDGSLETHHVS